MLLLYSDTFFFFLPNIIGRMVTSILNKEVRKKSRTFVCFKPCCVSIDQPVAFITFRVTLYQFTPAQPVDPDPLA